MNFKKLSKEKKNQLVLVGLITLVLMVGLGYGLIRFQLEYVKSLQARKVEAERTFKKMMAAIQTTEALQSKVEAASKELAAQEEGMAGGDKYSWLVSSIKQDLKQHAKLDVPDFSTPLEGECTLLAKFPYTQLAIDIRGVGQFHDLGRFLAEFENSHPHFRVTNLELEPASAASAASSSDKDRSEKLQFKFSVAALVKPN